MQERLEKGAGSLDDLVKDFGLHRGEIARFERGTGGLPLGSDGELNRQVFSDTSLTQRRVGGPLQLGEERMVIFQVQAHDAASTKPLDEVRADIVKAITRARGADAAYAAAQAAVADMGKGANFAQATAKFKPRLKVRASSAVLLRTCRWNCAMRCLPLRAPSPASRCDRR
ncbi:MAG: hypothetical protein WDO12_13815 [Pseudomonadota bacterium]